MNFHLPLILIVLSLSVAPFLVAHYFAAKYDEMAGAALSILMFCITAAVCWTWLFYILKGYHQ